MAWFSIRSNSNVIVFKVGCPETVNLSQHGLSVSIVEVVGCGVVDCVVDTAACVVDSEVDGAVDGVTDGVVDGGIDDVVDSVTTGVVDGVVEIVVDKVEVTVGSFEAHSKVKSVAIHLLLKHIQLNSDGFTRQVLISPSA